ncbi:MAG: hypothetical protein DRI94_13045 [Bacteroidetes bacterium]|nr:MAG: hypothetical protein DRI94_13045 [Bacteroidota bacterium]
MQNARETILNKLKKAKENNNKQINNIDFSENVYVKSDLDLANEFKENLKNVDGQTFICKNFDELKSNIRKIFNQKKSDNVFCIDKNIQEIIEKADIPFLENEKDFLNLNIGVTACDFLSARTGSVIVSSKSGSGRRLNIYPNIHIIIANKNQLVEDLDKAIVKIKEKYNNNLPSLITNITGPSRTADIEKTLILGAHGPKELIVFILDF